MSILYLATGFQSGDKFVKRNRFLTCSFFNIDQVFRILHEGESESIVDDVRHRRIEFSSFETKSPVKMLFELNGRSFCFLLHIEQRYHVMML